jgi:hypothetical protein
VSAEPQALNVDAILAQLKDFQRASVEYVFRRLYLDEKPARRFLVADEVGLGKTLVARGVIAKAIQHPITLLPIALKELKNNPLNFVSFTPGTTFDLRSKTGTQRERALLYWLLKDVWDLKGRGPKNLLRDCVSAGRFRRKLEEFPDRYEIDQTLKADFERALSLATTCLAALEPDLIILDEFQRFKHRELRRVMIRTERLGVSEDRSGMLKEITAASCRLEPGDVLEKGGEEAREIAQALNGGHLSLRGEDLAAYKPIDPGNARLRSLLDDTVGRDMWRLLWLPASLPYYQLEGAYKDTAEQSLTKRLVFSSWRVVPKVIAGVLSYEAERRMMLSLDPQAENTPEARKRRSALLQFRREADGMRLAGMPVLGLLYPSLALVEELDPLTIARECGANGSIPTLAAVLEKATERADALLQDVFTSFSRSAFNPSDAGPADENWYWAAPILIDRQRRSGEVHSWLNNPDTPAAWAGRDPKDKGTSGEEEHSLWDQHVKKAGDVR